MSSRRRLSFALLALLGACGAVNARIALAGDRHIASTDRVKGEAFDYILVLAGGVRGQRPSPILEDRLVTSLDLYRAGVAPRLLVTGDVRTGETPIMKRWLVERGVPESAVVVDDEGIDTYASMLRARRIFADQRAVVVTQRFHLGRALYLADALGLPATGVAASELAWTGDLRHPLRELFARPGAVLDVALGRLRHRG